LCQQYNWHTIVDSVRRKSLVPPVL